MGPLGPEEAYIALLIGAVLALFCLLPTASEAMGPLGPDEAYIALLIGLI
jgi:hypothetical protein